LFLLGILAAVLIRLVAIFEDLILSWWANKRPVFTGDPLEHEGYIRYYSAACFGTLAALLFRQLIVIAASYRVGLSSHDGMFSRVLNSTTAFFDLNPCGSIVSRFAKDIEVTDITISELVPMLVLSVVTNISTAALMCYAAPYLAPVIVAVCVGFALVGRRYFLTNKSLKKLEAANRDPMISLMSETLAGLTVLRAYGCEAELFHEHARAVALSARSVYNTRCIQRWFTVRLDAINSLIVLANAMLACALMANYSLDERSANVATVSLGLTYSVKLGTTLSVLITIAIELEAQMTGVVRVAEFSETPPQEQPCTVFPTAVPNPNWPEGGSVSFDRVQLRYRPDLPLALRGATFSIRAGEHIGVVGRTGSGKSTVMQALFRLVEPCGGSVTVDGIDTGAIPLSTLRSRMTIIPQDPMLFKGTVRSNLDPLGEHADDKLEHALAEIGLGSRLNLNTAVTENGECFSVGQRQLLCLARGMVRGSQIVLLDEATANVDSATDALMQHVIRRTFAGNTTITIAHRLETIMDSDRILVLDRGEVAEFASPAELLADANSIFHGMVNSHGHKQAELSACSEAEPA
jgi:ABC-type multidrug transport system fused ATPase/permease subunit